MKHLTTILFVVLSISLFGQDGGADQLKIRTNMLQLDSIKEITIGQQVKVLAVDENSTVGYTTELPPSSPIWNNKGAYISYQGNVAVGDTTMDKSLYVYGTIFSKEVQVQLSVPGPDYVFEPGYSLMKLPELQKYLDANKHLPGVPSAKEMETEGVNLSEMNMLLLKKVEELTLYMLEQQKEIDDLNKKIREKSK